MEECLAYAVEVGDISSQEYYEEVLSQGFKFVSIDGQNRTKNIISFFGNTMRFSGTLMDADGAIAKYQNVSWSDLESKHPRVADCLKDSLMGVEIHTTLSRLGSSEPSLEITGVLDQLYVL